MLLYGSSFFVCLHPSVFIIESCRRQLLNRITIFHYHLLPGGVTNVILLGAAALIRHYPDLQLLRLVCGREENIDTIRNKIEHEIDASGLIGDSLKFEICVEPEINYAEIHTLISSEATVHLAQKLIRKFGDSFWWIHNYQLGKNPLFTAAVTHIAETIPEQKLLLQIHDFPECARYDNLDRLYRAGVKNPYPVSNNTAFALINGRDTEVLKSAGISADRIFLLNNPVEHEGTCSSAVSAEKAAELKTRFFNYYRNSFPAVNPEAKLVFYPVRTIRRKNALEAGLLAAVSEQPVNLVLSLPGVSDQEQRYSDLCEQCFHEGLIPGIWGSGVDNNPAVPPYPEMLQLCDLILSSSVQEGFGYLFINSVQLGVPLVARNLDILDGIRGIFPTAHTSFYNSFSIPYSKAGAEELKKRYRIKLDNLASYISESALDDIRAKINNFGAEGIIDFSYIPVEQQADILKNVNESTDLGSEIHKLNETLMKTIYRQLNNGRYESDISTDDFSLKSHSNTLEGIISSLYSGDGSSVIRKNTIQQKLLDSFAEPQYMRLLYDY